MKRVAIDYTQFGKSAITALALGVVVAFVAVPRSHADDRAQCQQRTEQAEARLQHEIREHGENSPQVENLRREINVERERCWNQHQGWWSGDDRQWHDERNWSRELDSRSYRAGYRDGLSIGRQEQARGRGYKNPGDYKKYKSGDQAYRNGFWTGYRLAFGIQQ